MKPYLFALPTALTALILDQMTKVVIDRSMTLYQSIPVINGLFNITYVRNKGAAFSFLANTSWRLPFFIAIATIALIGISITVYRLRPDQKLSAFALGLIGSGAAGNLIDRIRIGEVVDFLDFYWRGHHWPAFNVADSAICVGVALLALEMLQEEKKGKARV